MAVATRNPKRQATEITPAFRQYEAEREAASEAYRVAVAAACAEYADAVIPHIEAREAAIHAARLACQSVEAEARTRFEAARAN